MARRPHPRPRHRPRHRGNLLPLDIAPAPQDHGAVLGLLAAVRGGASDGRVEGEYGVAVTIGRGQHGGAGIAGGVDGGGGCGGVDGGVAVGLCLSFLSCDVVVGFQ
jgi:hypothetical protein